MLRGPLGFAVWETVRLTHSEDRIYTQHLLTHSKPRSKAIVCFHCSRFPFGRSEPRGETHGGKKAEQ